MKKMNNKGFTIVELVIVIAVIGILAGVLIPTFSGITARARENAAMQEAKSSLNALLMTNEGAVADGTVFVVTSDKGMVIKYAFEYSNGKLGALDLSSADGDTLNEQIKNKYVTTETTGEGAEAVTTTTYNCKGIYVNADYIKATTSEGKTTYELDTSTDAVNLVKLLAEQSAYKLGVTNNKEGEELALLYAPDISPNVVIILPRTSAN